MNSKTITIAILFIALLFNSCRIEHTYLLSYELDGISMNHNEQFPQVMKTSEYKNDELVCVKYQLGYNVSDFKIICIDSSLNAESFTKPNIEVKFKIQQGDNLVEYEFLSGKVDLEEIKRKEEIEATFEFKLRNKSDSTDVIEIKKGFFQGVLNRSDRTLN